MASKRYEIDMANYGTENIYADQLDIDDKGNLRLFQYKEDRDYALPQLTTIAVYAAGAWLSVREGTKPDSDSESM